MDNNLNIKGKWKRIQVAFSCSTFSILSPKGPKELQRKLKFDLIG